MSKWDTMIDLIKLDTEKIIPNHRYRYCQAEISYEKLILRTRRFASIVEESIGEQNS